MSDLSPETIRKGLAARRGAIKRIHVNKHIISNNAKNGTNDAAITVQTSQGSLNARSVSWDGPSYMVHDAEHPLSCGAKVWIETRAPLKVEL
jgi:hypothetical protein